MRPCRLEADQDAEVETLGPEVVVDEASTRRCAGEAGDEIAARGHLPGIDGGADLVAGRITLVTTGCYKPANRRTERNTSKPRLTSISGTKLKTSRLWVPILQFTARMPPGSVTLLPRSELGVSVELPLTIHDLMVFVQNQFTFGKHGEASQEKPPRAADLAGIVSIQA